MIYILYITTNIRSGCIYIGVHGQEEPYEFDGYLGSGVAIQDAIKAYGRKSFIRETLLYYWNEDDAYVKEAEIVTEDFIKHDWNYNLTPGGSKPPHKYGEKHHWYGQDVAGEKNPFYGKQHSEETISLQSDVKKGSMNPMFGRKRPEHAIKMKQHFTGKTYSKGKHWKWDENKKRPQSPEHISKRIQARMATVAAKKARV